MNISQNILNAISKGLNEALNEPDLDLNTINKKTYNNYSDHARNVYAITMTRQYMEEKPMVVSKNKEMILTFITAHKADNNIKYHIDDAHFHDFINHCIKTMGRSKEGRTLDLNWVDTSDITNMSDLFKGDGFTRNTFNGDISEWDTSKVTDMIRMFLDSNFNGDISNWDVSKVIFMTHMFENSKFNKDISNWHTCNVKNMEFMFAGRECSFNKPIGNWDIHSVNFMAGMFLNNKKFTLDLSNWVLPHDDYNHKVKLRSDFPPEFKPHRIYIK